VPDEDPSSSVRTLITKVRDEEVESASSCSRCWTRSREGQGEQGEEAG
jgi:hypothetical protein